MSRGPVSTATEQPLFTEEESGKIRTQLERLLASSQFRGSRRCQLLLQYVTEHALAGETSQFKERTLGVAVFGREPQYDTNQDPIVRATAAEIRKKLAQYYQDPAHAGELRVSLLPGSYIPGFAPAEAAPPIPVLTPEITPAEPDRQRRWPKLLVALSAVAALALSVFGYSRLHKTPIEQFWAGMVGPRGVLFCIGQPATFNFRSDHKQYDMWQQILRSPDAWPGSLPPISPSDLVPMPDRYFAVGDAEALVHIASFLDSHKTPYFIRNSSLVHFADLREHASVMIGAFDNDWTLRFVAPLRFSFQRRFNENGDSIEWIVDRQHPDRHNWEIVDPWPDWNVPRDYAVVSRLRDPGTDQMLVTVAGITQYGTIAAGELLTNPEYFAGVEPKLPRDWASKNLQIVLQVPVVHGASGRPTVVAVHTW